MGASEFVMRRFSIYVRNPFSDGGCFTFLGIELYLTWFVLFWFLSFFNAESI